MLRDNINRAKDFLTDQRFLWNSLQFLSSKEKTQFTGKNKKVYVAITFDVEENYPAGGFDTAINFLPRISPILKKHNTKGTFFVQGELVSELAQQLELLHRQHHEIALHGYRHDNWGDSVWFWNSPPLSSTQKKEDLSLSLELFDKFILPRPKSFRAPNMNANGETIDMLKNFGFTVDSSWASFRYAARNLQLASGLSEIPVSNIAKPRLRIRIGFPLLDFAPFNLQNILKYSKSEFVAYINSIIRRSDEKQYLVFLAHPWEFYSNKNFPHCSSKNLKYLDNMFSVLEKKFSPVYVTMNQLNKLLTIQ